MKPPDPEEPADKITAFAGGCVIGTFILGALCLVISGAMILRYFFH